MTMPVQENEKGLEPNVLLDRIQYVWPLLEGGKKRLLFSKGIRLKASRFVVGGCYWKKPDHSKIW